MAGFACHLSSRPSCVFWLIGRIWFLLHRLGFCLAERENFFFLFPTVRKQRLIIGYDRWAHSRINRWSREFFQNVGVWTWIKELVVKLKTATLKSSTQPLNEKILKYFKKKFKVITTKFQSVWILHLKISNFGIPEILGCLDFTPKFRV